MFFFFYAGFFSRYVTTYQWCYVHLASSDNKVWETEQHHVWQTVQRARSLFFRMACNLWTTLNNWITVQWSAGSVMATLDIRVCEVQHRRNIVWWPTMHCNQNVYLKCSRSVFESLTWMVRVLSSPLEAETLRLREAISILAWGNRIINAAKLSYTTS
jgi:hypothetical protein